MVMPGLTVMCGALRILRERGTAGPGAAGPALPCRLPDEVRTRTPNSPTPKGRYEPGTHHFTEPG